MRHPNPFLAACLSACWAAGMCLSAFAGQAPAPPQPQGGADSKPVEEMSIEELRAYQSYYYASGGRDPLIMRFPTSNELGITSAGTGAKIAPTLEQMKSFLEKTLKELAAALKTQRYEDAIRVGDEALYVIDNEWPPLRNYPPELQQMGEQIRDYSRMAARLKAQQDITREFETLQLRVNGVAWSPFDSKAMVNGRVYSAGEVMPITRNEGELRVENIEERGVVFQFKGMRFRLPVEVHSNPAAPRGP